MAGRPEILFPLFSNLTSLSGIGSRLSERLHNLDIIYPKDMLFHIPQSICDRSLIDSVLNADLPQTVTVRVQVIRHIPNFEKGRPYKIEVKDEQTKFNIVYFHPRIQWLKDIFPIDEVRVISGKAESFDSVIQMTHPEFIVKEDKILEIPKVEPIYPLTYGLSQKVINKSLRGILKIIPSLDEWIEPNLKNREKWLSWKNSIECVHSPKIFNDLEASNTNRRRLAYDEFFAHQLTLAIARKSKKTSTGLASTSIGSFVKKLIISLSFSPTDAQIRAKDEIIDDISKPVKMNRLLQGDVGSGKTLVAVMAMLECVESGGQAAFMAPSEILARQHFETLSTMLQDFQLNIKILTGRDRGAQREELLSELKAGEIDILIGTHALFQLDVIYHKLRLCIIDEQHRFGVQQRMELSAKGKAADILIMSATPIPRSLSLAQYGDMDLSIIDEKPIGRKPIKTVLVSSNRINEIVGRIQKAIQDNKQVYWVCPLVSESEVLNLTSAEDRFLFLKEHLGEDLVGIIHGQQKSTEKDTTMERFLSGDIKVLVATTVIEVGVDVPNASIMVIEHAERFGLAQLHQLRGRVGRGSIESSCLLLFDHSISKAAKDRLSVLRETEDGFLIAEKDLKIRGGGDLIGLEQSGLPKFKIADLATHADLMLIAHQDARFLLNEDPTLTGKRGKAAKTLLYLMEKENSIPLISIG